MSKQLSISARFSILATAAVALYAAAGGPAAARERLTGASNHAEAPALSPAIPAFSLFSN
jgi:hypothetical protein